MNSNTWLFVVLLFSLSGLSSARSSSRQEPQTNSTDFDDGPHTHLRSTESDCLSAHNTYRRLHGVPELSWDSEVAATAQTWADHLASNNLFTHDSSSPYGENLFMWVLQQENCLRMTKFWYDEIGVYNFDQPEFTSGAGHFTQIVWRASKRLGCAFAKSSRNVYLVCRYAPPGNYLGAFAQNVPRPGSKPQDEVGDGLPVWPAPSPSPSPTRNGNVALWIFVTGGLLACVGLVGFWIWTTKCRQAAATAPNVHRTRRPPVGGGGSRGSRGSLDRI